MKGISTIIQRIAALLLLVVLQPCIVFAQSTDQNYVRSRETRTPVTTNTRLDQLSNNKDSVMATIQYVDGLGRPLQTIQRQASPAGNDVIQPFSYDAYEREVQKYLPYTDNQTTYGNYRNNALNAGAGVQAFYNPSGGTTEGNRANGVINTPYPYAITSFEASPLDRVVEQGAPGTSWQLANGHTVKTIYTTNDQTTFSTTNVSTNAGSRMAALYTASINGNNSRTLARAGNTATYGTGQLSVTILQDENWTAAKGCFGTTEEYKDKEGHVVLKRSYNLKGTTAEMLSTYYIYDERNLLAFVLPPGASPDTSGVAISQATLDAKCYQYRYDGYGRMIQKKLPGKGWEYMIYNKLNQVVVTQDSVQRSKSPQQWTFTKYDPMGRTVLTGIYSYGNTAGSNYYSAVQTGVDTTSYKWETPVSSGVGYTNKAFPKTYTTALNVTFYDTYTGIPGLPSLYNQSSNTLYSKKTAGLVTASKTLVLNTTADYLWTVKYYDEEGDDIRTFSQHYLGGSTALSQYNYDDVTTAYNFNKQPVTVTRLHYMKNSGGTAATLLLTSTDVYTYDHMGRKLTTSNTLKDGTSTAQAQVMVSKNTYNEIGQLIKKGLHSLNGTSFLQNVDYRYNARGWLTNINNPTLTADAGVTNSDSNDQFGMELKYDGATIPQYNGNIGSANTKTGSVAVAGVQTTFPALVYNYVYDPLNRLTRAISTTTTTNDNYYNENVSYDKMGNITRLNRYDKIGSTRTAIDSLTYSYVTGNRLDRVDDLGTTAGFNNSVSQAGEYTYDGNGNELTDLNKGLTQTYNLLNLPQTAVTSAVSIAYIYDAAGTKLRKIVTSGSTVSTTEYIGGIEYDYTGTTPTISFIQTEEGRARKSGTVYKYEYDLKDHLGNTRVTTTWNASDNTQLTPQNSQRDDYYAFGYTIQSATGDVPSLPNNYLYNHKELQVETGLYDYGARFYDPIIARWVAIDPMAEKGRKETPYGYAFDDPMRFTDPDGMWPNLGRIVSDAHDVFVGAVNAVFQDNTGIDARSAHSNPKAYNAGRVIGHVVSMLQGGGEIEGGAAMGVAGVAAAGPSGGLTLTVTGAGVAVGAHGTLVMGRAFYNMVSGNGNDNSKSDDSQKNKAGSGTPRKKSSKQLRKEWENGTGLKWPKDPSTGYNQDAHHTEPLANGGYDGYPNIEPKTRQDHTALHKENGDFKLWSLRRRTKEN